MTIESQHPDLPVRAAHAVALSEAATESTSVKVRSVAVVGRWLRDQYGHSMDASEDWAVAALELIKAMQTAEMLVLLRPDLDSFVADVAAKARAHPEGKVTSRIVGDTDGQASAP